MHQPAGYLGSQWVSVAIAAVAVVGVMLSRETYGIAQVVALFRMATVTA